MKGLFNFKQNLSKKKRLGWDVLVLNNEFEIYQ